jgi:hypothetical protein
VMAVKWSDLAGCEAGWVVGCAAGLGSARLGRGWAGLGWAGLGLGLGWAGLSWRCGAVPCYRLC